MEMYGHATTESSSSSEGLGFSGLGSHGLTPLLAFSQHQAKGQKPSGAASESEDMQGDGLGDSSPQKQFQGQKPSGKSTIPNDWSTQVEGLRKATCKGQAAWVPPGACSESCENHQFRGENINESSGNYPGSKLPAKSSAQEMVLVVRD